MIDEARSPETQSKRRYRFPLTLTALAGSAIAIPLYLTMAPFAAEEPVAQSHGSAPVAEMPSATPEAEPESSTPPAPEAEPVERAEAEPVAEEVAVPAAPAKVAPKPAAPGDAYGVGGLGLSGTGRGGGGVGGHAIGLGERKAMRREADKASAAMKDAEGGVALDGLIATADGDGYDSSISAGRLTAGAIDDRQSTELLDELRAKATTYDHLLAQAIPSHRAKGAAPSADAPAAPALEIAFVLDTTGSMGDELAYLKAEIRSIAEEIGREHPNVEQRYGLVVYKDQTDEYLVRHHDFQPLDAFVETLGHQYAGGGGDFPEAMDRGMAAAADLGWSSHAAKLVFLVADAPPHQEGYRSYVQATGALATQKVSVYPVASSGVETVCEYLMRWAARTTGGTYLFLTDHSGIGNAHADPHTPDYELKSLRDHMLDVIRAELGDGDASTPALEQNSEPVEVSVHVAPTASTPTGWFDRHGLFVVILGGVFLLGFAGDMASAHLRRR